MIKKIINRFLSFVWEMVFQFECPKHLKNTSFCPNLSSIPLPILLAYSAEPFKDYIKQEYLTKNRNLGQL